MSGFILGKKSEMKQIFNDQGERIPVTYIKTAPCYVMDIKTPQNNHYFAVKLAFGTTKNIKKPQKIELEKAGIKTPLRFFKEFRLEKYKDEVTPITEEGKKGISLGEVKLYVGDEIKPEALFKRGQFVNISGISKGKGFQGGIRRHGFHGGPKTHGQSDRERAPGSIGMSTTPGRVYKGKKMAGRMGGERITVKNLQIVDINEDGLFVKGLVPGAKSKVVEVRMSNKKPIKVEEKQPQTEEKNAEETGS